VINPSFGLVVACVLVLLTILVGLFSRNKQGMGPMSTHTSYMAISKLVSLLAG
jgi:hypothetical protein